MEVGWCAVGCICRTWRVQESYVLQPFFVFQIWAAFSPPQTSSQLRGGMGNRTGGAANHSILSLPNGIARSAGRGVGDLHSDALLQEIQGFLTSQSLEGGTQSENSFTDNKGRLLWCFCGLPWSLTFSIQLPAQVTAKHWLYC